MKRCLFFMPGPVPPDVDPKLSRFAAVTKYFNGDVIQTSWKRTPEFEAELKNSIQGFNFHLIKSSNEFWLVRSVKQIFLFLVKAITLTFENGRYDLVICYGLTKTAFCAYLIKLLTGAKMIIEVPCNPSKAFIAEDRNPSLNTKIQYRISQLLAAFLFRNVDGIRLLYPEQLDGFFVNPKIPRRVFHEYLPVSCLERSRTDDDFIMLLGYPWHRKGVDILIKAFKQIEPISATTKLKIMGYMTDAEIEEVERCFRKGDDRIELVKPMKWVQAMEYMSRCKFLVLASRSEAMGRVWLEAMSMGKPVICSAVDGVVHYVKHEQNGLLFKSEDVDDLAHCMQRLLTDSHLYEQLSNNGFSYAHEELNEFEYVEEYNKLADEVLEKG